MLLHESYMNFWANLTTILLGPLFFGAFIFYNDKEVDPTLTMGQTI